jgi:hypothetical protein
MRRRQGANLNAGLRAFSVWQKDVVGRFVQRGWQETEAEVLSCREVGPRVYGGAWKGDLPLNGYATAFRYIVDGRTYDGILLSRSELREGDRFNIRYNPARPDQNNSLATKLDSVNDSALWAYLFLLILLLAALAVAGVLIRH